MANPLAPRGIINMAGRIDMLEGIEELETACEGVPVVTNLMGGTPSEVPEHYREVSANFHVPLGVRQAFIWGEYDENVRRKVVEDYAQRAKQAGDQVQLIMIPGIGHFELISPYTTAWPKVRSTIEELLR